MTAGGVPMTIAGSGSQGLRNLDPLKIQEFVFELSGISAEITGAYHAIDPASFTFNSRLGADGNADLNEPGEVYNDPLCQMDVRLAKVFPAGGVRSRITRTPAPRVSITPADTHFFIFNYDYF